jgi:cysteine desulfurase/selenocysteine lyase
VFGPEDAESRGGAISFWIEGAHPHDVAQVLDTEGVCVRAGHHCAQPLMRVLGVPATTRASFSVYNGTDDIDALIRGLGKVRAVFG